LRATRTGLSGRVPGGKPVLPVREDGRRPPRPVKTSVLIAPLGIKFHVQKRSNLIMKSNNNIVVPEAKQAMEKFKMEAANEVGVSLKQGYNGDLTSREAGSIGGQMVKKMIESYENSIK
jgi:hypothetical protein